MAAAPRWIHGPGRDAALALLWVPFALGVHLVEGHPAVLAGSLSAVLLLSLTHQPLTLALVYLDGEQFQQHRRLFLAAPVVVVALVVVGLHLSFVLVAVVAGLWNAEHTLMQRYGITRIYGRKAGDEHGPAERAALLAWLVLAMVAVAANPRTPRLLARVNLGEVNRRGIALLGSLRPEAALLLVPVVGLAAGLTGRWVALERARGAEVNPAKYVYLGSTAALFLLICVDPVAGFAGYVGAHALEYYVIVHGAVGRRAAGGRGGLVGRLARMPGGRIAFFVLTITAVVGPMRIIGRTGTFTVATAVYLCVGAMHFVLDSVIWKLRRPSVAAELSVSAPWRPVPA